ncbi:BGTF surface domain-containing protein [Haloarculaceae archaeon H-GB2-1]|nr:hypothetical protein [Haloarculaceae archaeon H-GB1-1]MEA5387793.1 BGTF surface domain-containing protein [Haloarculaceae archaeon H-GB11]MEA5409292.1 BGTF surface domain-containing protein [Haloarculaceae archaeon H-GB2-1]
MRRFALSSPRTAMVNHRTANGGERVTRRWIRTIVTVVIGVSLLASGLTAGANGTHLVPDGERVTVDAGQNQTIRGESSLPTGTELTVRVKSTGETPFLYPSTATVTEAGTFATSIDFSDVPAGTGFEVTVLNDDTTLDQANGIVTECTDDCTAEPATPERTAANHLVYDGSEPTLAAGPGQTLRGNTTLDAGTAVSVRIVSTDSRNPFLMTEEATVSENGTFAATLDASTATPDTDVDMVVHHDGETLVETEGRIVSCDGNCQTTTAADGEWSTSTSAVETDSVAMSDIVEAASGGTAAIQVSVGDVGAVAVSIGDHSVNYYLNATVEDGNGDRTVRLRLNTSAAGHDETPTLTAADDADSVTVTHETDLNAANGALDPADYDMRVYNGTDPGGDVADIGTLVLHDGGTESGSSETAPSDGDSFELREQILTTRQGQTASVPIGLGAAESATLELGSREAGFHVVATVTDGSGDGRVVLLLDTLAVGDDATPTLSVANASDEVTVETEYAAQNGLVPADYDVALYRGTATDGEPNAIGTLAVHAGLAGNGTETAASSPGGGTLDRTGLVGGGALVAGGLLAVLGVGLMVGLFRR